MVLLSGKRPGIVVGYFGWDALCFKSFLNSLGRLLDRLSRLRENIGLLIILGLGLCFEERRGRLLAR